MSVTPTLRIDPDGTVYALSGSDLTTANAVLVTIDGRPYALPVGEIKAETVLLRLYMSVDGGGEWREVGIPTLGGTVLDYQGNSAGVTLFRVVAETALGALATTEISVDAASGAVWVMNASGEGVALRYNLQTSASASPAHSEMVWLDGEQKPTVLDDSPRTVDRTLSISGDLVPEWVADVEEADLAALEAVRILADLAGLVLVRMPAGDRLEGSIRGVQRDRSAGKLAGVSVNVTEARVP